jgi:hypothetical protein
MDNTGDPPFDLTGGGRVDRVELANWLAVARSQNLAPGGPYRPGDANPDGLADGNNFIVWNAHKFTNAAAWCSGDLTAVGVVERA